MSNVGRWRQHCAPIIAAVLAKTAGQDDRFIRKSLYDAYPFGERRYHPYKMWLKEIHAQRNAVVFIDTRECSMVAAEPFKRKEAEPADPRQAALFEESGS